MAVNTIPIVDLQNLFNVPFHPEDEKMQEISTQFSKALHEHGFAYLTNHGIPEKMITKAFVESKNFFELPLEVKSKYIKADPVKSYHGYVEPGQELLNSNSVHELRESYDLFKKDRYYPNEVHHFQQALESLENACRELDVKLLKLLAMGVKLDDLDFFCKTAMNLQDPKNVESLNTFRTLYYPPISDNILPGTVRCAEHSDYGIITLLFQDSVGGLEVKTADNQWIKADPIPNTIVVNTGDLLDCWTGNYFNATPHRVRVPEIELKKKIARQSMAFFLHPDDQVMVSPLNSEVITNQLNFEPISAFDYAMNKVKKSYGGY